MKKSAMWGIVIILILVVVAGIFLFSNSYQSPSNSSNTAVSGPNSVIIRGMAFSPTPLTIKVGDTVTWTNMDSVSHTVTSDSGTELDSQVLSPGSTYSHTFTTAGTYMYHCKIHTYMKGTIIVQ